MKYKNLLMAAASATVIASFAAPAAAVDITQFIAGIDVAPENIQDVDGTGGIGSDALITGADQTVQNTANSASTGVGDGDNVFIQTIEDGLLAGENTIDADADAFGDAEGSGVQTFLNRANAVDIDQIGNDGSHSANVNVYQQSANPPSDDFGGFFEVNQEVDNDLEVTAEQGSATANFEQLGQNTKNTVAISDEDEGGGTLNDLYVGQWQISESDQEISNTADVEQTSGSGGDVASAEPTQRGFNRANTLNVEVDVAGAADVNQRAGGGFFSDADIDQEVSNTLNVTENAADAHGNAEVTLVAAVEESEEGADDGVTGGGQVAANTLNTASFSGSIGTLSSYQSVNRFDTDTDQSAENLIDIENLGSDPGSASLIAEPGALGQQAFNTVNSLVVNGALVGSGSLVEQQVGVDSFPANGVSQIATNEAYVDAAGGVASISGLGQIAGVSVNTVSVPTSD